MSVKNLYGLIGKKISYSFSESYFTAKFKKLKLKNHVYKTFDIQNIDNIKALIHDNKSELKGLNVTIPYKESVIIHLDKLDKIAKRIGAVNTIKYSEITGLVGYNTDVYGFKKSITPLLKKHHKSALILGTGGASKAIVYVLLKKNIKITYVSRNPKSKNQLSYNALTKSHFKRNTIIVNCTPLGTFPNIDSYPNIPYEYLGEKHLLFDLTYNPKVSLFLKKGKKYGASIKNGFEMLELQADKSWEIWNET